VHLNISYHILVVTSQSLFNLGNPDNAMASWKLTAKSVFASLDVPISIYAATEKDKFRKPRIGIWQQFLKDNNLDPEKDLDLAECFFVGDAAGRGARSGRSKDFAVSDRYVHAIRSLSN
jgi:DNA 3'-phosphatase